MLRPPPPAAVPLPSDPRLPRHVGIIMDGNGRWAKARHLPRLQGHRRGVAAIRGVMEECDRRGVHILTLYAFSTENWTRPRREVDGLMRLFGDTIRRETAELHANGVQIRVIGRREQLSGGLREAIDEMETLTANNTTAILNVAINYGGRSEIVHAVHALANAAVDMTTLSEEQLSDAMYTAGLPDPDLIIRTAGEVRMSNFLLWQSAYAEYYATPTFWPDFGATELSEAFNAFAARERRYGATESGTATVTR